MYNGKWMKTSDKHSRVRGMTLVELLIVVSIIGVLSTIAVPTFRRMVQKARQAEAKVHLGAIVQTERGFFAQYGAYTTNLLAAGYEHPDQPSASFVSGTRNRYSLGFFRSGAPSCGGIPPPHRPLTTTAAGARILKEEPEVFNTGGFGVWIATLPAIPPFCWPASIPDDGSSFTVSATGVIYGNFDVFQLSTIPAADHDAWTIDQDGVLSNVQNGIK